MRCGARQQSCTIAYGIVAGAVVWMLIMVFESMSRVCYILCVCYAVPVIYSLLVCVLALFILCVCVCFMFMFVCVCFMYLWQLGYVCLWRRLVGSLGLLLSMSSCVGSGAL